MRTVCWLGAQSFATQVAKLANSLAPALRSLGEGNEMATGPFQGVSKSLCPCSAGSRGPIKAPGLIPRAETLPAVFRVSAPPFQGLESFPSKNGEAWKSWSGHFIPLCPPAQTASMCWVLRSEGRQGPGFLGLLEAALASGVQLRGPQGRSSQANPILHVSPLQPLGGNHRI